MEQCATKNASFEEWVAYNEKDIKEWAVHKTKEHYKKASVSNGICLAVFALVTFSFLLCLAWVIESFFSSFGDNGVGLLVILGLMVILGLIEALFLVTGIAFDLPFMLTRTIGCYWKCAKRNCHVEFARCVQIHAKGEDGWRKVVFERLDDKTEVTTRWVISEERIDSQLGTIQCLVYVGEKLRKSYKVEDARLELRKKR